MRVFAEEPATVAMDVVTNLLAVIDKQGWEDGVHFVKNLQAKPAYACVRQLLHIVSSEGRDLIPVFTGETVKTSRSDHVRYFKSRLQRIIDAIEDMDIGKADKHRITAASIAAVYAPISPKLTPWPKRVDEQCILYEGGHHHPPEQHQLFHLLSHCTLVVFEGCSDFSCSDAACYMFGQQRLGKLMLPDIGVPVGKPSPRTPSQLIAAADLVKEHHTHQDTPKQDQQQQQLRHQQQQTACSTGSGLVLPQQKRQKRSTPAPALSSPQQQQLRQQRFDYRQFTQQVLLQARAAWELEEELKYGKHSMPAVVGGNGDGSGNSGSTTDCRGQRQAAAPKGNRIRLQTACPASPDPAAAAAAAGAAALAMAAGMPALAAAAAAAAADTPAAVPTPGSLAATAGVIRTADAPLLLLGNELEPAATAAAAAAGGGVGCGPRPPLNAMIPPTFPEP